MPFDDCPTTLGVGDILREMFHLDRRVGDLRNHVRDDHSDSELRTMDRQMVADTKRLYQLTEELNWRMPAPCHEARIGQELGWLTGIQLVRALTYWRLKLEDCELHIAVFSKLDGWAEAQAKFELAEAQVIRLEAETERRPIADLGHKEEGGK